LLADRIGRTRLTMGALAISGACCVLVGFLYGGSPSLLLALCVVWGISIVADSAQFSAGIAELSERPLVGTMLTVQTCAGFLLTLITIHLVPWIAEEAGWRFAFLVLLVRMWRLNALARVNFPVAVFLKRFAAPLFVFIFGIVEPPARLLPGRQDHCHAAALHRGQRFHLGHVAQSLRHVRQHLPAQLRVRHLPAAEHHRHFDLIPIAQELARVPGLEVEIMVVDSGAVLHFLELNDVLLFLGRAGGLGFLELELPVVHDLDHGWAGVGGDLYEIKLRVVCQPLGLVGGEDAQLLVPADDADLGDTDLLVDAQFSGDRTSLTLQAAHRVRAARLSF
jgi:hypothetical protein